MPVDHLAAAEREDLHGGLVALGGDAEDVDRAGLAPVGTLPLGEVLDREEAVAVARRVLRRSSAAASRICRCSSRTIVFVSPERKLITPSMISP